MGRRRSAAWGDWQPRPPRRRRCWNAIMPEYLATGRRPDGRKVTENVVANSADEAVRLLAERGYDDVVLHNDDVMALFTRQRDKAEEFSPADYLRLRSIPGSWGVFVVAVVNVY